MHHQEVHHRHRSASNTSKLVVMFQAPLGSIDQTLTLISKERFVKEYMGILFVLLIERNTKFVGMIAMNQRCFLTAS
jgi:hypothetical protein